MILLGTALLLLNKKLATRAISAGHLASYIIKGVLKEATTFAERV